MEIKLDVPTSRIATHLHVPDKRYSKCVCVCVCVCVCAPLQSSIHFETISCNNGPVVTDNFQALLM